MTDPVAAARDFAIARHDGQRRKDPAGSPYAIHLAEVAALVATFGGDATAQAAAWLHDVVEDTDTAPKEIAARFGPEVAAIVAELTDDKALPKAERKRAQVDHAPGRSPAATLVKLCDKASNCASIGFTPPEGWDDDRRRAYLDWGAEVAAALPPLHEAARAHLDGVLAVARARIAGV